MGLRDMFRRSAKALFDEVVDRVLERRDDVRRDFDRWPKPNPPPPPDDPSGERSEPDLERSERSRGGPARAPATRGVRGVPPRRGGSAGGEAPPDSVKEPILTRTMAGVLAAQGFHERALRIYDHLLREAPRDTDLASEADAVRARLAEGEGPPDDEVAAVPVRRGGLLVSWKVTERSIARARAMLGGHGALAARVVVVARGDGAELRSDTREHAPITETGEHLFAEVPRGARCTASVGLVAGDRFVSVAHSRVVPT